jgi:hypothetical protein
MWNTGKQPRHEQFVDHAFTQVNAMRMLEQSLFASRMRAIATSKEQALPMMDNQ